MCSWFWGKIFKIPQIFSQTPNIVLPSNTYLSCIEAQTRHNGAKHPTPPARSVVTGQYSMNILGRCTTNVPVLNYLFSTILVNMKRVGNSVRFVGTSVREIENSFHFFRMAVISRYFFLICLYKDISHFLSNSVLYQYNFIGTAQIWGS